jgi:hypothetical protein
MRTSKMTAIGTLRPVEGHEHASTKFRYSSMCVRVIDLGANKALDELEHLPEHHTWRKRHAVKSSVLGNPQGITSSVANKETGREARTW